MKPLPYAITDDEFFFATEEQRKEWNARIAMGCEPEDLSLTGPLNIKFEPLPDLCTGAQYHAATPEQRRDWDQRWLESCAEQLQRDKADDTEADNRRGSWGI